jgi:hypothetical protein
MPYQTVDKINPHGMTWEKNIKREAGDTSSYEVQQCS